MTLLETLRSRVLSLAVTFTLLASLSFYVVAPTMAMAESDGHTEAEAAEHIDDAAEAVAELEDKDGLTDDAEDDLATAQAKLEKANDAFDDGEYDQAVMYAEYAHEYAEMGLEDDEDEENEDDEYEEDEENEVEAEEELEEAAMYIDELQAAIDEYADTDMDTSAAEGYLETAEMKYEKAEAALEDADFDEAENYAEYAIEYAEKGLDKLGVEMEEEDEDEDDEYEDDDEDEMEDDEYEEDDDDFFGGGDLASQERLLELLFLMIQLLTAQIEAQNS